MSLKSYFRHDDGRLNPLGFIGLGVLLVGVFSMVPMILFGIYWVYDMRVNATQFQTRLEDEFRPIQPPSNATSVSYNLTQNATGACEQHISNALSYPESFYKAGCK